jgi:hypothetical protein
LLAPRRIECHHGGHESERSGNASAYGTSCGQHDKYDTVDRHPASNRWQNDFTQLKILFGKLAKLVGTERVTPIAEARAQ